MIAALLEPSIESLASAYFAIRVIAVLALTFSALALLAVAAGKWLKRVSEQFEDDENRENE